MSVGAGRVSLAYPRWPRTGVLVTDAGTALLLQASRQPAAGEGTRGRIRLEEISRVENPSAHLASREMTSDRTGRVFDSAGRSGHGPPSRARHGAQSDYDPHDVEIERFANEISRRLDLERERLGLQELVIIAAPRFLGVLRPQLSAATRHIVIREISRDLVRADHSEISRAAFG